MIFKFVALLAFVAVTRAGVVPAGSEAYSAPVDLFKPSQEAYAEQFYQAAPFEYAQPAYNTAPAAIVKAQLVLAKDDNEYDPHPQYKFGYSVQDTLSGDSKSQFEIRSGDVVEGQYSLIDADGYKRTVQYISHPVHGFNAVVHRQPIAVKTAAPALRDSYDTPIAP